MEIIWIRLLGKNQIRYWENLGPDPAPKRPDLTRNRIRGRPSKKSVLNYSLPIVRNRAFSHAAGPDPQKYPVLY